MVGYTRTPIRVLVTNSVHACALPVLMPKPGKARKVALQREETRRLERQKNLGSVPAGGLAVETRAEVQTPRPWGTSRTSKWRDENEKTKKSRAMRMQPSVLKFFSVSTGNMGPYPRETLMRDSRYLLANGQPIDITKGIGAEREREHERRTNNPVPGVVRMRL